MTMRTYSRAKPLCEWTPTRCVGGGTTGTSPDELKGLHNIFAPEVAGVWQVAYWMGAAQGVW